MEYLQSFWVLVTEMTPFLLLGFLFAGILHVAVPTRIYRTYLSGRSFKSVLYASLFGIPLPLCSCGVIPTAMSLRREGASKGATSAFLTSTPQTGVDSILATYSVFGLALAIIRPLAAFVTSLFSGIITNLFDKDTSLQGEDRVSENCEAPKTIKNKFFEIFRYGFVNMLQDIGGHLVLGLFIAGLIAVFVPDSFFLLFSQNVFLEMLIVLLISVPMYVCATGSIPIAAAMMLKGLSPSAALVFLMAGPATNFASLLVVNKVLGRKSLFIYLICIIAGAIVFGTVINYLPQQWFLNIHHAAKCCEETIPLWKKIASVLFFILLLNAMILKQITNNKTNNNNMENTVVYLIKGMSCNHCTSSVENNLKKLDGVISVNANLGTGHVTVTGKPDDNAVKKLIDELGFEYIGRI